MPPKEITKSRNWGQADKSYLAKLINTGQIDITDCSYQNIELARDLHFRHQNKLNFRCNFREYSAAWALEIEYSDARRRDGGKMRHFILLFFPLFASTYALPPPGPLLRQFQTKRKSPTTKRALTTLPPAPTSTTPPLTTLPLKTLPPKMPPRRPGSRESPPPAPGAKKATKKAESDDVAAVPAPATKPPANYSVDSTEKHFISYYKGKSDVATLYFSSTVWSTIPNIA